MGYADRVVWDKGLNVMCVQAIDYGASNNRRRPSTIDGTRKVVKFALSRGKVPHDEYGG